VRCHLAPEVIERPSVVFLRPRAGIIAVPKHRLDLSVKGGSRDAPNLAVVGHVRLNDDALMLRQPMKSLLEAEVTDDAFKAGKALDVAGCDEHV
jgi:hypothetical protein